MFLSIMNRNNTNYVVPHMFVDPMWFASTRHHTVVNHLISYHRALELSCLLMNHGLSQSHNMRVSWWLLIITPSDWFKHVLNELLRLWGCYAVYYLRYGGTTFLVKETANETNICSRDLFLEYNPLMHMYLLAFWLQNISKPLSSTCFSGLPYK